MTEITDRNERLQTDYFDRQTVEHLHRYAVAQSLAGGLTVLDIACGEGYGTNLIAQSAARAVGVDVDGKVIAQARLKYQRANLSFAEGSASAIPLTDASVDLVVSFETLEHLSEHEEMFSELRRVLRSTGVLLISTPDRLEYSDRTGHRNPYHVRELYTDDFLLLGKRYFKHVCLFRQKLLLNSLIAPFEPVRSPIEFFSGDLSAVSRSSGLQEATYNIMVASNGALPSLNASIFDGRRALDDLVADHYRAELLEQRVRGLTDEIANLRNSYSFRLGAALLRPLRWLRAS